MPGAVFPAERGLRARGPKPARQDFRRPNRASQVCKDSLLEEEGFEPSVPRSRDDGFRPNFPAFFERDPRSVSVSLQRRVKCEPDSGAHPTTGHLGRACAIPHSIRPG
jgi:hypothetical protein